MKIIEAEEPGEMQLRFQLITLIPNTQMVRYLQDPIGNSLAILYHRLDRSLTTHFQRKLAVTSQEGSSVVTLRAVQIRRNHGLDPCGQTSE